MSSVVYFIKHLILSLINWIFSSTSIFHICKISYYPGKIWICLVYKNPYLPFKFNLFVYFQLCSFFLSLSFILFLTFFFRLPFLVHVFKTWCNELLILVRPTSLLSRTKSSFSSQLLPVSYIFWSFSYYFGIIYYGSETKHHFLSSEKTY